MLNQFLIQISCADLQVTIIDFHLDIYYSGLSMNANALPLQRGERLIMMSKFDDWIQHLYNIENKL